jgi:hypothetical protein
VLDIGSKTGWYSKLAALQGSKVVAFDIDSARVTRLYYDARDRDLPILPLVMDFTKPTPTIGFLSHHSIAATERFKCDLVLALGIVQHIAFMRSLTFEQIVGGLSLVSKRWLVVEFVPAEDESLRELQYRRPASYVLDILIAELKKKFNSISVIPFEPAPRVLVLCEK